MWFKNFCALIVLCISLACCGWKSVYYESDVQNGNCKTAVVQINPVPNESGRILTQKLSDILNPCADNVEKKYILKTQLTETLDTDQGIIGDNTTTRATMRITGHFQLIEKKTEKVLLNESTFAVSSYNILWLPYPTVTAQDATRKRLINVVAEQIGTRVAVFFNKDEK